MKYPIRISAALAAIAVSLSACGSEADADAISGSDDRSGDALSEIIGDDSAISVFAGMLDQTGIASALEGDASYTVFAPSNDAIEALGKDAITTLGAPGNGAIAAAIVREHMVPGSLTPESIRSAIEANGGAVEMRTFGTGNLSFAMDGGKITVSAPNGANANLTGASSNGSNGALFIIDAVLADPKML